jgi:hypothetical protein
LNFVHETAAFFVSVASQIAPCAEIVCCEMREITREFRGIQNCKIFIINALDGFKKHWHIFG